MLARRRRRFGCAGRPQRKDVRHSRTYELRCSSCRNGPEGKRIIPGRKALCQGRQVISCAHGKPWTRLKPVADGKEAAARLRQPYAVAGLAFFAGAVMCGLTAATIASNAAGSVIASSLSILRFKPMPLSASAGMKRL